MDWVSSGQIGHLSHDLTQKLESFLSKERERDVVFEKFTVTRSRHKFSLTHSFMLNNDVDTVLPLISLLFYFLTHYITINLQIPLFSKMFLQKVLCNVPTILLFRLAWLFKEWDLLMTDSESSWKLKNCPFQKKWERSQISMNYELQKNSIGSVMFWTNFSPISAQLQFHTLLHWSELLRCYFKMTKKSEPGYQLLIVVSRQSFVMSCFGMILWSMIILLLR